MDSGGWSIHAKTADYTLLVTCLNAAWALSLIGAPARPYGCARR